MQMFTSKCSLPLTLPSLLVAKKWFKYFRNCRYGIYMHNCLTEWCQNKKKHQVCMQEFYAHEKLKEKLKENGQTGLG